MPEYQAFVFESCVTKRLHSALISKLADFIHRLKCEIMCQILNSKNTIS